jgi:uncharacterized protein (TIGR01244 family)
MRQLIIVIAAAAALGLPATAGAQVQKETVPGVRNFAHLDTTIACAGATTPEGVAEVKKRGYAAVIDLRESTENGANIDEEEAAARTAGLHFIHLPFNEQNPDSAIIQRFIQAVTDPANQPAFVHCASGNRASALWMIKRIDVDGWAPDRAAEEAAALGLTKQPLKDFALNYAAQHKR